MKKKVLEMKQITKKFTGVTALDNVTFDLEEGEILCLCGENGAGKSTLMKILSGSYPSNSYEGEIHVDGERVFFNNVKSAEKAGIEMIYQEISLMLDLSVAENIFLGNLPSKRFGFVDMEKLYDDARYALGLIDLDIDPREKVRNLSMSNQQLLTIVKAYMKKPKILVLDEPTSALTEKETNNLFTLLMGLKQKGISCIYISHKLDEVFCLADRITVLRDGKKISTHNRNDVTYDRLIEDMVGRKIESLYPKEEIELGEEVLRVENLCVPHPYNKSCNISNDICFNVRKGEILGLAGLVGAGRSETLGGIFKAICKNVKGKIFIDGREVHIRKPQDAIRNGMGFITEDRKSSGFVGTLSIKENSTLASLDKIAGRMFINDKKETGLAETFFKKLRVKAPSIKTSILSLSGGNQQKVVVSKWLMTDLKILLFDEPTRGIDIGAKAEIYSLMSELAKQGVAIVMVSSEMPELLGMCDRIIVLGNGRIQGEFLKPEFSQTEIMKAAIAK